MKESYVQRQILDCPGRRFIRFGTLGSPDIVCVITGQYVGIEVKAPKGKLRDSQMEFQKNLETAGGRYILAYSLDDVMSKLS
jgi:VRR-NUC domain